MEEERRRRGHLHLGRGVERRLHQIDTCRRRQRDTHSARLLEIRPAERGVQVGTSAEAQQQQQQRAATEGSRGSNVASSVHGYTP